MVAISFWTIWCSLHWKHRKEKFGNGGENGENTRWGMFWSSWVPTKHRKDQVFNKFVATPIGQQPKNSWQYTLKISLWLQTSHRKEKLFIILFATHKSFTRKIKGAWMSQRKTKTLTCLHANQRKEQLFNLFDARHGKANRGGMEPQLSWKMLSRALLVNSCSIEVDMMKREPLHTKFHKKKLCAW